MSFVFLTSSSLSRALANPEVYNLLGASVRAKANFEGELMMKTIYGLLNFLSNLVRRAFKFVA